MRYRSSSLFDQLLLPYSRAVAVGLVLANISVGLWLLSGTDTETLVNLEVAEKPTEIATAYPLDDFSEEVAPLVLLAEVPQEEPPVEERLPRECRVWGPEPDPGAFADIERALHDAGGFPEVKATDISAAPDYLVVIEGLGSLRNARAVLAELDTLEIDNYLIHRDGGELAISVGVFSRESLARRQHVRVTELGYDTQIQTLERSQTVYNLTAHIDVDSEFYDSSTSSCVNIAQGI